MSLLLLATCAAAPAIALASPSSRAPSPALLARRSPPRGFNPCNGLGCDMSAIGEPALMALMDSIAANGMRDAGYTWFNLDDGIASHRDATGALVADAVFTNGSLATLAAHAHALGLQLGAYTDRGAVTCENRPGAAGHEAQDAATWVDWGVTWLKEDSCDSSSDFTAAVQEYSRMKEGLAATGADVFFSLCGWFSAFAAFYTLPLGDSWRVSTDVPSLPRFAQNIEAAAAAAAFAGPNKGWPDVDMIGGHWSAVAERLHVTFIAVIGAPLLLSWNISAPTSTLDLSVYLNPELLSIHSDDAAPAVAARGRYYSRLSGGAVTAASGITPPTLPLDSDAPCDAPCASWVWTPNATGSPWGSLESSTLPGFCLGLWDDWGGACIDAISAQLVPCGAHNASDGCGADAQLWSSAADGSWSTAANWGGGTPRPGPLLTAVGRVPGALFVQSAAPPSPPITLDQAWSVLPPDAAAGATTRLQNTATGRCLAPPAAGGGGGNVWVRWLADGDIAMLLFNFDSDVADVTCDAACFASAGLSGSALSVRDVWSRVDLPAIDARVGFTATALEGGGGSLLLRISGA